jgi:flagellar hook-associated protein 3 FlgL
VAALVLNDAQTSEDAQFQTNIGDLQSKLQVGNSVMSDAAQLMTSAISLGTEGATGTTTASERQTIAAQVTSLQQQMLSLANTTYQGTYIFSGTNVTTPAFTADASSPSGVDYNGNSASTSVEISQGQSIQTNLPGNQVFLNSSGNVFGALNDLANALNSGTGIAAATTEVQNAFNQINSQAGFYGNALNQLQSTESYLSQETVNLSSQQNSLIGANLTQAATNLSQDEMDEQASESATAQIIQLPNVLDYIE